MSEPLDDTREQALTENEKNRDDYKCLPFCWTESEEHFSDGEGSDTLFKKSTRPGTVALRLKLPAEKL